MAKPGSAPDSAEFYGPQDFYIGSVIEVFSHRFVITNADSYVLSYMEEHSGQFPGKCLCVDCFCSKFHIKELCLAVHHQGTCQLSLKLY